MTVEQSKMEIEKGLSTLWIIWAAIMGSLVIYVLICHLLGDEIRGKSGQNVPLALIRNILYGIAFITLFLTHFLKRFMLTGASGGSMAQSIESGPSPNTSSLFARYMTAFIVSLALSESIGIYGFVLYLLGDSLQTLYLFIGVSALAIYIHRPKREEIEALARAMQTGEGPAPEI